MFPTMRCWSINVSRYSMCIQIDMELSQVSYFKCLDIEHWTHQQKMSIVEHFNDRLFAMLKIVSILLLFTSFRIDILNDLNEEVIVTYYSLFTSTSSFPFSVSNILLILFAQLLVGNIVAFFSPFQCTVYLQWKRYTRNNNLWW